MDNNKYMEKSDMIAETINASGPNTTPIIANVNGNDNTPPPTTAPVAAKQAPRLD